MIPEDPYAWLREPDTAGVRAWLADQQARTRAFLGSNGQLEALVSRMKARLAAIGPVTLPHAVGGRFFGVRRGRIVEFVDTEEREVACIDGAVTIAGGSITGATVVVARRDSSDEVQLCLLDTGGGDRGPAISVGVADLARGGVAAMAGGFLYYGARKNWQTPVEVRRHWPGDDPRRDTVIYEADPETAVEIHVSPDERWIAVVCHRGEQDSKVPVRPTAGDASWRDVLNGVAAHVEICWLGPTLLANTDWQAPNRRILAIDPETGNWHELVAERDCPILHTSVAGGRLFVGYLDDVCTRVEIFDGQGFHQGTVPAPGRVTQSPMYGGPGSSTAAFTASDDCHPVTRFWYGAQSNQVAGTFPASPGSGEIVTRQIRYASRDGTRVPMRIVRRADTPLDGNCPTILLGYGGWGASQFPWYDPFVAEWVDLGGVYAVANIRGGGEFGKAWHDQGRLLAKHNVFDDFEWAMRWLCDEGVTSPERLAIRGFSAGGLLTAVMVTRCPSRFAAAMSHFGPGDLTSFEVNPSVKEELGDPEDPVHLANLLSYSPYHNVMDGVHYPAVFFRAGGRELRVPVHDSFRMTARLQAATASANPVLLRHFPNLGHGINRLSASLDEQARYDAEELAFVCRILEVAI